MKKVKISNLDVAWASFWQLLSHWKKGDNAKLELNLVILTTPISMIIQPPLGRLHLKRRFQASYAAKSITDKKLL